MFFLLSFFPSPETISIKFIELNLIRFLEKNYEEIILYCYKQAKLYSEEPMDETKVEVIIDIIHSVINKYSFLIYNNNFSPLINNPKNTKNIFDFLSDIFCTIVLSYKLLNGNKRIAFSLLVFLLYDFGYYLKYTKQGKNYWKYYVYKIEELVKNYHENKNKELMIIKLKEIIINNIVIALNF